MTPQETHAAIVQLLQSQGVPLTTDNLNRGMLALSQSQFDPATAQLPNGMDAQIARTEQRAPSPQASGFLPTPPIPPQDAGTAPNQPKADVRQPFNRTTPDGSASAVAPVADTAPQEGVIDRVISQIIADPMQAVPGVTPSNAPQQRTMANSPVAVADPTIQALSPYALPEAPDVASLVPLLLSGGRAPNLQLFLRDKLLGAPRGGLPQLPGKGGASGAITNTPTPRLPSPTQALPAPQARATRSKPFEGEAVDNFSRAEGGVRAPATEKPSLKKTLTAREKNSAQRSTRKTK